MLKLGESIENIESFESIENIERMKRILFFYFLQIQKLAAEDLFLHSIFGWKRKFPGKNFLRLAGRAFVVNHVTGMVSRS